MAVDDSLVIRGRIDRIDTLPDGRALIVDYKYSAAARVAKAREDYGCCKAGLYALAWSVRLAQAGAVFYYGLKKTARSRWSDPPSAFQGECGAAHPAWIDAAVIARGPRRADSRRPGRSRAGVTELCRLCEFAMCAVMRAPRAPLRRTRLPHDSRVHAAQRNANRPRRARQDTAWCRSGVRKTTVRSSASAAWWNPACRRCAFGHHVTEKATHQMRERLAEAFRRQPDLILQSSAPTFRPSTGSARVCSGKMQSLQAWIDFRVLNERETFVPWSGAIHACKDCIFPSRRCRTPWTVET